MGDLYGLLGLESKTTDATEKEIRNAYRKLALRYHPDKVGGEQTESDKQLWLKI